MAARVRLLALDVDGTVVRRDGVIDERDRRAVADLQQRGVPVTLITGRLWAGTQQIAEELQLQAPALGCADGAEIVDPRSGVVVEHRGIAGSSAIEVRETLVGAGLAAFLMVSDGILHDEAGERYARYVRNWSPELRRVASIAEEPCWQHEHGVAAIVAIGGDEVVRAVAERWRAAELVEVMEFALPTSRAREGSEPERALLLHASGVHKGTALERVAHLSGCEPSEVAVVGDWLNDIDMFRVAGRAFAMGQAPELVRAAATDLLAANGTDGGGVAEAIARIVDAD